jgi:hypothetical protein
VDVGELVGTDIGPLWTIDGSSAAGDVTSSYYYDDSEN